MWEVTEIFEPRGQKSPSQGQVVYAKPGGEGLQPPPGLFSPIKNTDIKRRPKNIAQKLRDGNWLCAAFQDGKCIIKAGSCTKGRHQCAAIEKSGRACGAKHPASKCTNLKVPRR